MCQGKESRVQFSDLIRIEKTISYYIHGDRIDKEQLAVDIWMELWEKNLPYSALTLKHRCYDKLRWLKKEPTLFLEENKAEAMRLSQKNSDIYSVESVERLDKIIEEAHLTHHQRRILFLYFYQGKSGQKIADIMDLSKAMVHVTLNFILKKLRETCDLIEQESLKRELGEIA